MKSNLKTPNADGKIEIFCRYITRKGKRIYPKKGKFFHFFIDSTKLDNTI